MRKMLANMIAFKANPQSLPKERTKFFRELYGYTDFSQFRRYKYERKGLLSDIPYISPVNSVLIVRDTDTSKVISFLNKWNAKVFVRSIVLDESDKEDLGVV